jgi:hypothetical protein
MLEGSLVLWVLLAPLAQNAVGLITGPNGQQRESPMTGNVMERSSP